MKNVSVLVAVYFDDEGYRRILGFAEGHKEDKAGWSGFLEHLNPWRAEKCQDNHN